MNQKPWQEVLVDKMGLIVALGGEERYARMAELKTILTALPSDKRFEIENILRERFTPTNGSDGCHGGTDAVRQATRSAPLSSNPAGLQKDNNATNKS